MYSIPIPDVRAFGVDQGEAKVGKAIERGDSAGDLT